MNTTLRTKIQEDHLTCPICFLKFTKPKALPCLHTFCLECLNDYVVGRNFESEGKFPCPVCRADVQLPPQGVSGFPDNHIVASLIDTVEETRKVPNIPPRPSQARLDEARKQHDGHTVQVPTPPQRVSPVPGWGQNQHQPRGASPVPPQDQTHVSGAACQDQTQHHRLFGSGAHRQYIGKLVTDGIGTAKDAINSITGYLYPQHPTHPASTSNKAMSPYEIVDRPNFPTDGQTAGACNPTGDGPTPNVGQIYPELVQDSSGPCMDGCIASFGQFGGGVNDFLKPYGLAAGKQGEIIVSDKAGSRVLVFNATTGQLVYRFNIDCELSGITTMPDNNLMIAVSKSKSAIMRCYAMNGKFLQSIGDFYQYDVASGINVTPNNYVLVTNVAAENVLVFTDKRKASVKFGRKGKGDNHFTQPKFVTSTSKNYIIVSDSGNDCIKMFDITGNFKRSFGKTGDTHGSLNYPLGVATDADDNIIIADSNNYRVEIFTPKGTFYTTFLQRTNLIGPDVKPINVSVTNDNNIAVLLYGTGFAQVRIYKWRPPQGGRLLG